MVHRVRRSSLWAALTALVLIAVWSAVPAAANFGNGPSQSGVVERVDSPGFTFFIDFEEELLLFVNVDSILDACTDNPAGSGMEQLVFTPSGRVNGILHDNGVPLILAPLGPPDLICANPGAWPVIATGEGNVRASNGGFRAVGTIHEPTGQTWNVRGTLNATGETLRLVRRG